MKNITNFLKVVNEEHDINFHWLYRDFLVPVYSQRLLALEIKFLSLKCYFAAIYKSREPSVVSSQR